MWFIIGAIKYVLENMYFRYIKKKKITGAKKKKGPIPALLKALA